MAHLRRVWSGRAEDAEHRSNVLRKIRAQSMEFSELNVEYGYAYASAAVVADGSPPPETIDDIGVYAPSTRPGAPLPHACIDDEDGNRCGSRIWSSRDVSRCVSRDWGCYSPRRRSLVRRPRFGSWSRSSRRN